MQGVHIGEVVVCNVGGGHHQDVPEEDRMWRRGVAVGRSGRGRRTRRLRQSVTLWRNCGGGW